MLASISVQPLVRVAQTLERLTLDLDLEPLRYLVAMSVLLMGVTQVLGHVLRQVGREPPSSLSGITLTQGFRVPIVDDPVSPGVLQPVLVDEAEGYCYVNV